MRTLFQFGWILFLFLNCIPAQKVTKDNVMTDFFHFQKAEEYDPEKWAVFLPGTGGLRIFKDTSHYYNMAAVLNRAGISVLLLDNVAAYKASGRKVKEPESEKILWVLHQGITWAKENNYISGHSSGSIVGWSRAGIGLVPLAGDAGQIQSLSLESMVLFYPANPDKIDLKPKIPVLVLTGGADRIIKTESILQHMVAEGVSIKIYEDAYHGFDVESLKKGKYYRYIPFISKKIYLLKYDSEAAEDATKQMKNFLIDSRYNFK